MARNLAAPWESEYFKARIINKLIFKCKIYAKTQDRNSFRVKNKTLDEAEEALEKEKLNAQSEFLLFN